jgi:hypothetical protein
MDNNEQIHPIHGADYSICKNDGSAYLEEMDDLTILTHSNLLLTKKWLADGSISAYDKAKHLNVRTQTVRDIEDAARLLKELAHDPHSCVIRGRHSGEAIPAKGVLRQNTVFADQPLHLVMVDIDNFQPLASNPVEEPVECIDEYLTSHLPAFAKASYYWQLSSSAGHAKNKGTLKAHVWFWLASAATSTALKEWAKATNYPADKGLFQQVQIHYTANPVFEPGVDDPVPVRCGFEKKAIKAVVLDLTDPLRMPSRIEPRVVDGIECSMPLIKAYCEIIARHTENAPLPYENRAADEGSSIFQLMAAIYRATAGSDEGMQMVDDMLCGHPEYNEALTEPKWLSIPRSEGAACTVGTLIQAAKFYDPEAAYAIDMEAAEEGFEVVEPGEVVSGPSVRERVEACETAQGLTELLNSVDKKHVDPEDLKVVSRLAIKMYKGFGQEGMDAAAVKAEIGRNLRKTPAQSRAIVAHGPVKYPFIGEDGSIPARLENAVVGLRHPVDNDVGTLQFDTFRGEAVIADGPTMRPLKDTDLSTMQMALERRGFAPLGVEMMRRAVDFAAETNTIDSAREWVEGLQWDGVGRVADFAHLYFGMPRSPYAQAVSHYIWTAAAARAAEPGIKTDAVPVLVGEEGLRKTEAVKEMAPVPEAFASLDLQKNADDISRKMRGTLIMEWAEMRGLKTKDEEAIKDFVTRGFEEWTPKFKEFTQRYGRRCLIIGTTNDQELLPSYGKARRWLPLQVTNMIDVEAISRDRDQLWAEGYHLFKAFGVLWQEAGVLATSVRDDFREEDPMRSRVMGWLDAPAGDMADEARTRGETEFLLADLEDAFRGKGLPVTSRKLGTLLRDLGCRDIQKRDGKYKRRVWRGPGYRAPGV